MHLKKCSTYDNKTLNISPLQPHKLLPFIMAAVIFLSALWVSWDVSCLSITTVTFQSLNRRNAGHVACMKEMSSSDFRAGKTYA